MPATRQVPIVRKKRAIASARDFLEGRSGTGVYADGLGGMEVQSTWAERSWVELSEGGVVT